MLVLCLDTSTPDVAAAVVDLDDAERCAVRVVRDARAAGELLMPCVTAALADLAVPIGDVAAISVGTGPGPYTGLRVGVVTGAVLGMALGVPTYACCSLDIWAADVPAGPTGVVVATDARRREVFWAAYDTLGRRDHGPAVDLPADLALRLTADLTGRHVTGPGAVAYPEQLCRDDGHGTGAGRDRPAPVHRLAGLAASRVRAGDPGEQLMPVYLRRPDAAEPVPLAAARP